MSIQGNINQALGIGTALLSQTGVAEATKEERKGKHELKRLTKTARALGDVTAAAETDTAAAQYAHTTNEIIARKYQLATQLGDVKGINEALGLMSEMEDVNASYANARADVKANSKRAQKERIRGFKDGNN